LQDNGSSSREASQGKTEKKSSGNENETQENYMIFFCYFELIWRTAKPSFEANHRQQGEAAATLVK